MTPPSIPTVYAGRRNLAVSYALGYTAGHVAGLGGTPLAPYLKPAMVEAYGRGFNDGQRAKRGRPGAKKRYLLGPFEDPADGPNVLMSLENAVDDLRSRFEEGEVGDELTYRVVELTDAEVDALPEL